MAPRRDLIMERTRVRFERFTAERLIDCAARFRTDFLRFFNLCSCSLSHPLLLFEMRSVYGSRPPKLCQTRKSVLAAAALPVLALLLLVGAGVPPNAAAAEKVEQLSPQGYVNDFAGVIDADSQQKITALARSWTKKQTRSSPS